MKTELAKLAAAGSLALLLTGCASTAWLSTWSDPATVPLGKAEGRTIIACVVVEDVGVRHGAEDALAAELTNRGAKGVQSYRILPPGQKDEARAKAAFEKIGAAAVVVMRPLQVDKEVTVTPVVYSGPQYRGFYGGYWNRAWDHPYPEAVVQTDTLVTVEVLFYSLEQNRLVWAGQSKTTNPPQVAEFVQKLVKCTALEMSKSGVLKQNE